MPPKGLLPALTLAAGPAAFYFHEKTVPGVTAGNGRFCYFIQTLGTMMPDQFSETMAQDSSMLNASHS